MAFECPELIHFCPLHTAGPISHLISKGDPGPSLLTSLLPPGSILQVLVLTPGLLQSLVTHLLSLCFFLKPAMAPVLSEVHVPPATLPVETMVGWAVSAVMSKQLL